MRSMTGFGTGTAEGERFRISVTARAVNHRYLDLVLRLRDELRVLERPLRELLTSELHRGRVEVGFEIESLLECPTKVSINRAMIVQMQSMLEELETLSFVASDLTFSDLLRFPDAVKVEVEDPDWRREDLDLVLEASRGALAQLVAARSEEGRRLALILAERLEALSAVLEELVEQSEGMPKELAASLDQRIRQLLEDRPMPDEARLAQEVALLVDRTDIREELDRLRAHLGHFAEIASGAGTIGKRLDFLAQEIFRELNTIGSKCRDAALVGLVLEGKALCEQIREQVQNVE